jgi:hypothetical protein
MGKRKFQFIISAFLLFACLGIAQTSQALTEQEKKDGFVSLFNGKDLTGWKITGNKEAFGVEDDCITCYGKGGQRLQTENQYENFILRFDYKISKNGNNGIYVHCPDHGRESRVGGEIQVKDDYNKPLRNDNCGSLYDVFPPLKNACKPHTEWQTMEIDFQWPILKVIHNGVLVQDRDVSTHDRSKYRAKYGYLAIQDHSDRVWYKNIRVKDLGGDDKSKWTHLLQKDSLDNWYQIGETNCEIKNGVLTVKEGTGYLISKPRYENFELWTYYKTDPGTENGLFIRWKGTRDTGLRTTIANDKKLKEYTGSFTGLVPADTRHTGNNGWYPLQIIVNGKEAVAVVNGRVTARYDKTDLGEGNIVIDMLKTRGKVQFKEMRVKPF